MFLLIFFYILFWYLWDLVPTFPLLQILKKQYDLHIDLSRIFFHHKGNLVGIEYFLRLKNKIYILYKWHYWLSIYRLQWYFAQFEFWDPSFFPKRIDTPYFASNIKMLMTTILSVTSVRKSSCTTTHLIIFYSEIFCPVWILRRLIFFQK